MCSKVVENKPYLHTTKNSIASKNCVLNKFGNLMLNIILKSCINCDLFKQDVFSTKKNMFTSQLFSLQATQPKAKGQMKAAKSAPTSKPRVGGKR